ncbi:MAG TPA: YetF domain-containing protein [Candidatus Kapabacteria bacterium]|jgi:uncharacterized membrane protein YcaP (DUF421 family)|nr:YetF domain-containing protein [Candidatus Kapabacteria bacterium]
MHTIVALGITFGKPLPVAFASQRMDPQFIRDILGTDPRQYTIGEVALRALITYVFTVFIVKLGHKRFMGRTAVFDTVLGFMLGSVMSRGVNGQSSFVSTLAAGLFLVVIHWCMGWLTLRSRRIAWLMEGTPHVLFKDGQFDEKALRQHLLNREDVEQYMRSTANVGSMSEVERATLEKSGSISIVKAKRSEPQIIEIKVEQGVQTVKIELG